MYERAGISGIAHDLATILGVVRSSLRFVAEGDLSLLQRTELERALDAAKSAAVLAERLIAVSHVSGPPTAGQDGPTSPSPDADEASRSQPVSSGNNAALRPLVPSVLVVDEGHAARAWL
ncbi:MAG TPA: hypothetical protein VNG33_01590, partial [Polyangiaceae bacterium]|nr:hypothetical protein [Polyangiaceae bacterium]